MTKDKILSGALIYRGDFCSSELESSVEKFQNQNTGKFQSWIPNGLKRTLVQKALPGHTNNACLVANSTSVRNIIYKMTQKYGKLYKKLAFVHWYTSEGLDSMEFEECYSNQTDLEAEYEQYIASYDHMEEGEEEEE